MLPEGVSIVKIDERDWDDLYVIGSGRTYCFQFIIPWGQRMRLGGVHTKPTAQDLSLRCWLSLNPYGAQYFPDQDNMDVFPLTRALQLREVGATDSGAEFVMPADTIVYLNVQNIQNSENIFKLIFEYEA